MSKICDTLCSIIEGHDSYIKRTFFRKSEQPKDGTYNDSESMKRLAILTSEMKENSNDLRSHEMLLGIATDYLNSPIWGKDTDSKFVFMNDACATKILKKPVVDALRPLPDDYELNPLEVVCMHSDQLVQATMKTHRFFEHARFDDGTDLWLDTTKSPWLIDGELVGTVGMGRDISKMVPEHIKEKYKESGYVEIPVDILYNSSDIRELVKPKEL